MGEDRYHEGAQDGYAQGYNIALANIQEMIRDSFPDPNPLSSIFTPYIGYEIIDEIEKMKG